MVFERDRDKGLKICRALEAKYNPTLLIYQKEDLRQAMASYDLVVAVMAVGIVVRSLCGQLFDKWTDTPVLAVDSSLRVAVPVIGGHHGANDLARELYLQLEIFPAITTGTDSASRPNLEALTESLKATLANKRSSKEINLAYLREDVPIIRLRGPKIVIADDDVAVLKSRGGLVVGIGSRRGVSSDEVLEAVTEAIASSGRRTDEIRVLATAWLKEDETGISQAASKLEREVIYLSREILNAQCSTTPSRASDLGLLGVAEPAAMALSTRLVMPKKIYGRVTVALGE
jgi:cobalt-precorrin 5A hydrolase